jgi:peptidoglycan/xylan/chitin deacetylase (PgdA/CDA1 family)
VARLSPAHGSLRSPIGERVLVPGLLVAAALAAALTAAIVVAARWSAPHRLLDRVATRFPGCRFYVPTHARAVALTIDDGPDPATTSAIVALLARYRAHATFFVITARLRGHEDLAAAMVREGHELGNHLTDDVPSIRLDAAAFAAAVRAADRALRPYTPPRLPPRWLRPASGWYSPRMIRTLERQGYRCALGSVYPFDAAVPSSRFAAGYILRNVRPGSIVVLHDGGARGRRTLRTLARVLPALEQRGYAVLTLSALQELAGGAERR